MKHIKKFKISENFQSDEFSRIVSEGVITVEYYLLNENMSDEELNNAPEKEFIITEQMIIDLIEQNTEWDRDGGDYIDTENLYIKKI
jgi:hypothetical protein